MKKISVRKWIKNVSIKEKLYFVIGIMAFLIAAELFILYFTIHTLSSTRAFVGGEGLYSKAQKEAAYNLRKYAITNEESDYRAFQKFIDITRGDRKARLEMEKENPDQNIVYEGFLQGRNNPDDIVGMIQLVQRFRGISYISKAISIWSKGDSVIDRLIGVGIKLHVLVSTQVPYKSKPEMAQLVAQIDLLNSELTVLEDDFTYTLGEGSRWLENLIMKILVVVAVTVECTGLFLTVSVCKGITLGLDEIMRASENVGRADFSGIAKIRSNDEIGQLAGSFNQMVSDLRHKTEQQKHSEESLRRQKDLYETLIVAQSEMGEGVVITEEDSIVFANQALCLMYGYSEKEMMSVSSYINLVPLAEQQKLRNLKTGRLSGLEVPKTGETAVVRKDGRIIDIEYSRKIIQVGSKTQIVSIVRDITDQRLAEKRIKELAAIVLASDDAIKTLTMDGVVINWNMGAEKLYGYSAGEIIGQHVSLLSVSGMEDEFAHLTNKIRNGEHISHYESVKKCKNGLLVNVSTTASPILDKSGNATAIAIIARDISQSKMAALALRAKSDELARSNADLEQFAYMISHDLREPLRTITSYVQLLQTRYRDKLDDEANEFIGFATEGAKRMTVQINDLLTYSRVGYAVFQFEDINAGEVLETALDNLQESIRNRHAEIVYSVLPQICAGRIQLLQLFQNLIGNAIKFNKSDVPKIQISARNTEAGWLFSISDNGIGIEKKFTDKVFKIFQRLHTMEEYEGTGIGLAICKKIVERHDGKIWCESEPGRGSVFHFTLNHSESTF